MNGLLRLNELDFPIASAEFEPFFDVDDDDDDFLAVGVNLEARNPSIFWPAGFRCDVLKRIYPGDISSLKWMPKLEGGWSIPENEYGDSRGLLVALEQEPVLSCKWSLEGSVTGKMKFELSGFVDLNYDSELGLMDNVRLQICSDLDFSCIWCGRSPETEIRQLLKKFGLVDEFSYVVEPDGVGKLVT